MSKLFRTAALAVAAVVAGTLCACSSSGTPSAGNGTSPAASASASAAMTQWAGSVCSSVLGMNQSLKNLAANVGTAMNGKGGLDQLKHQLQSGVAGVEAAAESVTASLGNLPEAADQSLKNAKQNLQSAANQSQQSLQRLHASAKILQSDTTSAQLARDFATLSGAAAAVTSDIGTLVTTLRQYASSAKGQVKQAFGNAPSCQQLKNG